MKRSPTEKITSPPAPGNLITRMSSQFIIYGLVDPRDGQLRYVGKSCSGKKRPSNTHRRSLAGREGRTHKANWIFNLHESGFRPGIVVIQEFDSSEILSFAERHWIAYFRQMGCPLTNLTDGGDGAPGHKKTINTIQRMRAGAFRRWGRSEPLKDEVVIARYLEGKTLRAVATELKTSSSMIFQVLKRHGVQIRPKKVASEFIFVPGKGMVRP